MQTSSRTRRRALLLTAGAVAGLLALGACTPEPAPTPTPSATWTPVPIDRPDIIWDQGPEGPWEDDPWVQTLRTYLIEQDIAENALNFSDPQLSQVASEDEISFFVRSAQSGTEHEKGYAVWTRPTALTIMGVSEAADGKSATIDVCLKSTPQDYAGTYRPNSKPVDFTYGVHLDPDGHRRVQGNTDYPRPGIDCTDIPMPQGRFDPEPVPEPPHTYTEDDVILPAFYP